MASRQVPGSVTSKSSGVSATMVMSWPPAASMSVLPPVSVISQNPQGESSCTAS